jgi:hypothetical protein
MKVVCILRVYIGAHGTQRNYFENLAGPVVLTFTFLADFLNVLDSLADDQVI